MGGPIMHTCPVCGKSDAIACKEESRFYLDGHLTAICFHGHDTGNPILFYVETGTVVKKLSLSLHETFYKTLETSEARGFGPAFLASACGLYRVTRNSLACVPLPFPTEKDLIESDKLESVIMAAPLYDGIVMSGLELRRVEINNTVPGKWYKVLGNQGVYIANPAIQPKVVVVFEGVWDAVAGAWDAFNHDSQNYAFCAIKAGTQPALLKRTLHAHLPGIPVLIITDQDNAGKGARSRLKKLGTLAILPGAGLAKDYRAADPKLRWDILLDGIERALTAETPHDDQLARNEDGDIRKTPGNLAKILRSDPLWSDRLSKNEMTQDIRYDGHVVTDAFVDFVQERIEDSYGLPFGREEVACKIAAQAEQQTIHPVREMLLALPKHDGTERLGNLASLILNNDDPLPRQYLIRFLVGAVRRVFHPGLKMDSVPVLVGKQGIGKSTFWRILASDSFFVDSSVDLESKDGAITIHRGWITELGEIDHVTSQRAQERVKSFLSQSQDTYRPPFGRSAQVFPRSCVIVGSTNREGFLTDPTGSRRYWPILCPGPIQLDTLLEWREQLLAEAITMMEAGVEHYLPSHLETIREENSSTFEAPDPWFDLIDLALNNLMKLGHLPSEGYAASDILTHMGLSAFQQTRSTQMHLAELLKQKKWTKKHYTVSRTIRWFPEQEIPEIPRRYLPFSEVLQ